MLYLSINIKVGVVLKYAQFLKMKLTLENYSHSFSHIGNKTGLLLILSLHKGHFTQVFPFTLEFETDQSTKENKTRKRNQQIKGKKQAYIYKTSMENKKNISPTEADGFKVQIICQTR